MKNTVLLTLVLLTISYPVLAKPHYHGSRHSTYKADDNGARDTHSQITCEMVREYVAQVGLEQAMAMAQSAGITVSDKQRARRCLGKST